MLRLDTQERIEKAFEERLPHYQVYGEEILAHIEKCEANEQMLLKYFYATMPLSDGINYDFKIFLDYAKQGVFLRHNNPYSQNLSDEIFLNYVVFPRINEEEIDSCRTFFYEALKERIDGKTLEEAILEVNYWCCEEATYQSTDERTASALTVFKGAYGRCGEESVFTVSALRSVGIAARQVYAPRWSHCDDNHAWVEVYVDENWHFLGACEPEEILDKGWFTNASSRAMLVHSRWFDTVPSDEEKVGQIGCVTLLNHLPYYAHTQKVKIKVLDANNNIVKGAKVEVEILNYAHFYPIITLLTDENGEVTFTTGLGTVQIVASSHGLRAWKLINTKNVDNLTLTLGQQESLYIWQKIDMIAPTDAPIHVSKLTPFQKERGKIKSKVCAEKRAAKVQALKKKWTCDEENLVDYSRGNYEEIKKFLEDRETLGDKVLKEKLLTTLTKKDFTDVKAKVLLAHLKASKSYSQDYVEEIFVPYILSPRIAMEPLTDYKTFIRSYFSKEEKENFIHDPRRIWEYIQNNIKEKNDLEYENITTSPVGTLKIQAASEKSKRILFVAICRSLGIPAKIDAMDGKIMYYHLGEFVPVKENTKRNAMIQLVSHTDAKWVYMQNWTLGKWNGQTYQTLDLQQEEWEKSSLQLKVEVGRYRIITTNRLPNGNSFIYTYSFEVSKDHPTTVTLQLREAKLEEMLQPIELPDFIVQDEKGHEISGKGLINKNKGLMLWLEVAKEPTEHILNELFEHRKRFLPYQDDIIFFVKAKEELDDVTLQKVLNVLPNIKVYYDTFEENIELLARRMYVDPDKLPLILVVENEKQSLYATSGYNVGTGDMLLRILN
jgi:hypothetical protein